jgi:hypothetical protein
MADWLDDSLSRLAATLSGSELQSALLDVMHARAHARAPADVLAQYKRDRFVMPTSIDQRESVAIDAHVLATAADFIALELSPVTPLGTSSVMAPTDQNRVLSALRGTEVVSDPTNVFALECASRMRAAPGPFHFTTSHRVVRAQPVPKQPGFTQHFRLFALASGGIETKDHAFTVDTVAKHIATLTAAFDRLEQHGYAFGARRIDILATAARTSLAERIAARCNGIVKPLEHAYYSGGLRYMYWVTTPDGNELPLGDGGTFDWLQKLCANRRAVYVASGMGAQLVGTVFKRR